MEIQVETLLRLVRKVNYIRREIALAEIHNCDMTEVMFLYLFLFTYSAGKYCKFYINTNCV